MSDSEILKANADRSKTCATLFLRFQDYLPASSEGAVTSVVTDLFGVSRALLDLRKSVEDPRNDDYLDLIEKDRETVSRSVTNTLRDIQKHTSLIEELQERKLSGSSRLREAYELSWKKIGNHFADEGSRITGCDTLTARLETYIHFLKDVKAKLEGDSPSRDFRDMRFRLEKLLQKQEKSFEESMGLGRLSLGPEVPKFEKQKSWERKRPEQERPQRDPRRPARYTERPSEDERPNRRHSRRRSDRLTFAGRSSRLQPATQNGNDLDENDWSLLDNSDEQDSSGFGEPVDYEYPEDEDEFFPDVLRPSPGYFMQRPGMLPPRGSFSPGNGRGPSSVEYFAPLAPDPPSPAGPWRSPVSSSATPTSSTLSSETNSSAAEHWLPVAFGLSRSSTPFRTTSTESGCFGDHESSAMSALHNDGYDRLLKLPFEDSSYLTLYIYVRDEDRRAKILIRQDRGPRRTLMACDAASNLRIIRNESCLQLCHPQRDAKPGRAGSAPKVYLWTSLRFATYERMVIFWCTFHALKMQDEHARLMKLQDAELAGEVCLYSGLIEDDNYEHALHLLRDRDSKGLRLQASALKGHMKRCPIWTAFITYQISSKNWARRVERNKIHLQDLTRFVFTHAESYEPRLGPKGEHEIRFVEAGAAKKFMETLEDVADGKL